MVFWPPWFYGVFWRGEICAVLSSLCVVGGRVIGAGDRVFRLRAVRGREREGGERIESFSLKSGEAGF